MTNLIRFCVCLLAVSHGLLACSTQLGTTNYRCDPRTDPGCGDTCTGDSECTNGLHCGTDGTCTAECVPGENHCQFNDICDTDGRCIPGADADGDAFDCPSIDVDLDPVIPTVILLIDQSGSMNNNFNGQPRWDAVREALVDETNGVVTNNDTRVRFGATLYTSNNGFAGGTCPILDVEPPALMSTVDIRSLLDNNSPGGETPTGESIDGVRIDLEMNPPPNGAPGIIVVATDGEPDTCAVPNPQNGQPEAIAAAQAAFAAGFEVYPLSVGSGISLNHLQDMANAGVGLPVNGPDNAPVFVANNTAELVSRFDEIIRGARSCELTLDRSLVISEAATGTVRLDTGSGFQDLVFGVDWQVVDADTIELIGTACDDFLNSDSVQLEANFPCGAIVD